MEIVTATQVQSYALCLHKNLSAGKIWENSTTVRATWLWFWSSMKTFSSLLEVTLVAQKGSADRV